MGDMKRALLSVLLLPLLACSPDTKEDNLLPSIDSLPEPERSGVVRAPEEFRYGAISLTLDAEVTRDGGDCILRATVRQTVHDDGPAFEQLGDAWTLERGYLYTGGVWSTALERVDGPGRELTGRARGVPRLDGQASVVVRLVNKDGSSSYLAKLDVPQTCGRD